MIGKVKLRYPICLDDEYCNIYYIVTIEIDHEGRASTT